MSSMLEQAIIDAKALKESAMKNAENMIIEKYSDQIKEAVNSLLEQEEEDEFQMGDAMDAEGDPADPSLDSIPTATAEDVPDVDDISSDDQIISIDLPQLVQQVKQKEEELGIDLEAGESHEELAADLGDAAEAAPEMDSTLAESEEELSEDLSKLNPGLRAHIEKNKKKDSDGDDDDKDDDKEDKSSGKDGKMPMGPGPDGKKGTDDDRPAFLKQDEALDEDYEISDDIVDAILERLKVDIEPQKAGWLNVPESVMEEYEDMVLAREADTEVAEEKKALRDKVKKLQESLKRAQAKNKDLTEENGKFRDAVHSLKEKVDIVNVSNAKLLYINQTLENPSLNERQKRQIVEAISKAETPKEAKVIYETLQGSVGSTKQRKLPESLSEAVNNNSSMILSSQRKHKKQKTDIFSERMKLLAGIKK